MAQVPYAPYPTEHISSEGLPALRPTAIPEAFGAATGKSKIALGTAIDRAGDELFKRAVELQKMQNKAEADEADANFMEETGRLHAEYATLRGQAAVEGLEPHIKAIRATRERIRGSLTTDDSRRLYDSQTRGYLGREMARTAGHAATENRRWLAGASEARVQAEKDHAFINPSDEESFSRGVESVERETRYQGTVAGWGKDQADQEVKKQTSGMISLRIAGMARTDPETASKWLESARAKGQLTAEDADRADKIVISQQRTIGSRIIVDRSSARDDTVPIEKVVADVRKDAEKTYPGDPTAPDFAEERARAARNKLRQDKRERDFDNQEIIDGALVGAKTKGKLPTTVEELFAIDPRAEQAWENLDKRKQLSYLKALQNNSRMDKIQMTPERLKRWSQLKGLADDDPEKFLTTDIISEDLPNAEKKELYNLWLKKRRDPASNPFTTKGLKILEPMMNSAGILRTQNLDDYLAFRGDLTDALEIWQAENKGKSPKTEDYMQLGSRLLQQQKDPEKWSVFGLFNRTSPMFKLGIPDDEKTKIINAYKADNDGREPNDDEIRRFFFIKQWIKLYGKKEPARVGQ